MMNTNSVNLSFAACRIQPTSQDQRRQIIQRLDPIQDEATRALLKNAMPGSRYNEAKINLVTTDNTQGINGVEPVSFEINPANPAEKASALKAEAFLAARVLNDLGVKNPENQIEEDIITEDTRKLIVKLMTNEPKIITASKNI